MNNGVRAVFKLGGSLFDLPDLAERVLRLATQFQGVLIVPGGGRLADCVRVLDARHHWPTELTHELGIRAMSHAAKVIVNLDRRFSLVSTLPAAEKAIDQGRVPVLDVVGLRGIRELPCGWDVTSDSISGRVAAQTGWRRLVLLKSVDLPIPPLTLGQASEAGLVDRHFPIVARELDHVDWVNLRENEIRITQWNTCVQMPDMMRK